MKLLLALLLVLSFSVHAKVDHFISAKTLAASFDGDAKPVLKDSFSIHLVYSGTAPTGDIEIEASNDGTTWEDIPSGSVSITTDGSTLFNFQNAQYEFVRVKYTRTSGTGTLDAYYAFKEIK